VPHLTQRVLIFGNSGAGKSTLAQVICQRLGAAHLDLDTLAWEASSPPVRRPVTAGGRDIDDFIDRHESWVIEGCYADLLASAARRADTMIFLNPGVAQCVANCRARPWEPHKYESEAAQNRNLEMLVDWVRRYPERDDEFSLPAHRRLFDGFPGVRLEYRANVTPEEVLAALCPSSPP